MPKLFLDTGFAIALASPRDTLHEQAVVLAEALVEERPHIVTTQAVLIEIGNARAAPPHRVASVRYIENLRRDPTIEVLPTTEDLFEKGLQLYKERQDKGWSLADCISFVVMREQHITE